MKIMLIENGLAKNDPEIPLNFQWIFNATWTPDIIYMQDFSHILTKMYRRLHHGYLIIGEKPVTVNIINILLQTEKDTQVGTTKIRSKYGLRKFELERSDTMSMRCPEKICKDIVIDGVRENVPNSEGLVLYLKMMQAVQTAYISPGIKTEQRVYSAFWLLIVSRLW